MKILLATQGSQGVVALRELFAGNFRPDGIHVAVCGNGANGPLLEFINYNKIKLSEHNSGPEFTKWLINVEQEYDVLLSISWSYLFSEQVIKHFSGRAINFHPGILPNYRGCFSIPWSIINQEKYVGFTYHYISEKIDEGDIIFQEKIKIGDFDTAHSLNHKVFQLGLSKLVKVIGLIGNEGKPQPSGGQYYPNSLPFNGKFDKKWSSKKTKTFMRAMFYPPHETSLNVLDDLTEEQEDNGIE